MIYEVIFYTNKSKNDIDYYGLSLYT